MRSLADVIDLKSLLLCGLAVLSTWLCQRYGLTADFPLTLIATAIVFPIVFSIGHAFKRRESALDQYASLKAHGRAIYLAARDWLGERDRERLDEGAQVLGRLLEACREMFTSPKAEMRERERAVYRAFSELSLFVRRLREDGLASGECSRANQYLSKMVVAFERIKHIYQYRTPRTLRAFSDFFILTLPVLYGPYFAYQASEYSPDLVYVMPILFTLILVGLDNIQDHLENPFDQIGEDDVAINAEKFVEMLESGNRQAGLASEA